MHGGRIGRITPEGEVSAYPLPTADAGPAIIAAGAGGALWFTEHRGNNIGRISTDGSTVEYPLPTAEAGPFGIAAGPDGAVWFVEIMADRIGRITTAGRIVEYPLRTPGARQHAIIAGSDGALWFTQWGSNHIGRITVTGDVSEYAVPTPGSELHGIVAGPAARCGSRRRRKRSGASSCVMSGRLDAVRAGELLRRQEDLQAEAEEVIGDLDLGGVLGRARSVRLIGSSVTGLMVWRDLDLQVLSPGLSAAETWEMVRPLAAHPQVHEVRFLNQAGANSFSGDPRDSGHYFQSSTARSRATTGSSTSPCR